MDSKKALIEKKNFWHANNKLADLGATYLSLLVFDKNNVVINSQSSDPEWAEEFTSTGLYKECHLLSAANEIMSLKKHSFTLAWDFHLPETQEAKALDEIRKTKDITHGIGFCITNKDQSKVMLNIAAKYSDINFGINILKNREKVYKDILKVILNSHR
ncbi:MAG: hypothetical protein H2069_10190 [Legionella sp.]|nr:hypothetical protein [Legionella sp.]